MTRSHGAAFAVAACLLLTACSGGTEQATTTGPAATAGTPSTPSASGTPADELPATPSAVPTTAPAGARQPVDLALATMTAFVDHTRDADGWFDALAPFLSDAAQQDWIGTDPAEIGATTLVGLPIITAQTDYLTSLEQTTDAGAYRLLLSRAADGTWQVERITPPEQGPVTP